MVKKKILKGEETNDADLTLDFDNLHGEVTPPSDTHFTTNKKTQGNFNKLLYFYPSYSSSKAAQPKT